MASSATVLMATQVPEAGWAPGYGKVRLGGPEAGRFLWLTCGSWHDGRQGDQGGGGCSGPGDSSEELSWDLGFGGGTGEN